MARHFVHDLLPCPSDHLRIVRSEVCTTEGEIESGLTLGFIFCNEQPFSFFLAFRWVEWVGKLA